MSDSKPKYDFVAVNVTTMRVRILDTNKKDAEADSYFSAVVRRGAQGEWFSQVPTGAYKEGDTWTGSKLSCSPVARLD